jgi:O-antigen ligase
MKKNNMPNRYTTITQSTLVCLIIFASLSITLPTAFASIAMGLFVITWAISGDYSAKCHLIRHHPAALIPIVLFVMYGLAMLYSSAPWNMRLEWWLKYHKLLYIPMIISVLTTERYRRLALQAFLAGMLLVLLISYLKWLGIAPHNDNIQGFVVFKSRIAHNIFMAFTMCLMLQLAVKQSSFTKRCIWIGLSLLAAFNILFLVNGRTGQIVMFVLLLWFCWETWGIKSIKWLFMLGLVTTAIYVNTPNIPNLRLNEIRQELADHKSNENPTSAGQRMEWYKNALSLIQKKPILGGGTGSFEHEYKLIAEKQKIRNNYVPNPHNEFLLTWQELGIIGLILLLSLFAIHWKTSYKIDAMQPNNEYYGYALRGLVITIFVGSLFNSLLLDSGEGRFYCVLAGVFLSAYQPRKRLI